MIRAVDLALSRGSTPPLKPLSPGAYPPLTAADPERQQLQAALTRARGVVAKAAAKLGLGRQAFYRRMDRVGSSVERRVET